MHGAALSLPSAQRLHALFSVVSVLCSVVLATGVAGLCASKDYIAEHETPSVTLYWIIGPLILLTWLVPATATWSGPSKHLEAQKGVEKVLMPPGSLISLTVVHGRVRMCMHTIVLQHDTSCLSEGMEVSLGSMEAWILFSGPHAHRIG